MGDRWSQRLRLLLIAGVAGPLAMSAVGFALAWFATGSLPHLLRLPSLSNLGLGGATAIASMGLVTLLYKSSKRFEQALRQTGHRLGEEALRVAGYPVLLIVVTLAGLGEEILFRGGLQPLVGLLPAALLFGLSHGGWRREMWAYVVAASLSGSLFGLVYWWTGDLWVPMIAHGLHNIMATLLLGRRVDFAWDGPWPVIRLLPEESVEEVSPDERPAEPLPDATDRPDDPDRDRDPPARPAE